MSSCNDDACKIDAIVTMDAKGQIVLPKDLREKADLKPTDKIAVVAYEKEGKVCCIVDDKGRETSWCSKQNTQSPT